MCSAVGRARRAIGLMSVLALCILLLNISLLGSGWDCGVREEGRRGVAATTAAAGSKEGREAG